MTTSGNAELLDLARSIALEAGAHAARRRAEGVTIAATKSTAVDVVTEADRETEALIRARLADARPDDGILGEEEGGTAGTSGLTWVVDPIDGTTNYLYGIPHYAVSIAVVEGDGDPQTWRPLVGVVRNPAIDETFTAVAGEGSWLGGTRLHIPDPPPLERALIGTGFAYAAETRAEQGPTIAKLLPLVRDIRRLGTASLDLSAVGAGRLDAFFERTLSPWDHAAGGLVAVESGAVLLGRDGRAPDRDLVLAVHPALADQLMGLIVEFGG